MKTNVKMWANLSMASLMIMACAQDQNKPEQIAQNTADQPNVSQQQLESAVEQSLPASHPKVTMPANAPSNVAGNVGRVIETLDGGGYTYVQVENQSGQFWLASSLVKLDVGQEVRWGDYAVMKDFHSSTLNRTFPQILFVSRVSPLVKDNSANQGTVVSFTQSAGYTYIEADTSVGTVWIAAPEQSVVAGDSITWQGGTKMTNFFSKSLKKNFETIYFVGGVNVNGNG